MDLVSCGFFFLNSSFISLLHRNSNGHIFNELHCPSLYHLMLKFM